MKLHRVIAAACLAAIVALTMGVGNDCDQQRSQAGSAKKGAAQHQRENNVIRPVATGANQKTSEQPRTAVTAADIYAPVFTAQRNPDMIVATFPRPMVKSDKVGQSCGTGDIIVLRPQVQASCTWADPSTMAIKPADGLKFYDGFDVEVVQVETDQGVIRSPGPKAWSATFKLSALKVQSARTDKTDLHGRDARLILVFTGPVAPNDLKKVIDLKLNNTPVEKIEVVTGTSPQELSVQARLPKPELANKLTLFIPHGLPSTVSGVVMEQDYMQTFDLGTPPGVSMSGINVTEGMSGYYISVSCYERNYGYRDCTIAPDSFAEKVKITPEVHPRVAPGHGGFRIYGDFHQGDYKLTMQRGLATETGSMLLSDITRDLKVPHRTPRASFAAKGRYVARDLITKVPVKHINLDEIVVTARRVPEANMVFWLSGQHESFDDRTSDVVASKTFKVENKQDVERTSWLDLSSLAPPDAKGVYEFTAFGEKARSDTIRVVLTRIALVAKRGGENGADLAIWALDSETLAPKKDVAVDVVTESNRVMASARTNADGLASFPRLVDPIKQAGKGPFAVIARAGDDLTLLKFSDLEVPLSEYRVQGDPYHSTQPYRAVIYADRGVYRPSETAHLVAIIWEDADHAPAKALPLVAKLFDPRGKTARVIAAKTNDAGMAVFDLHFDDFADTGKYDLAVLTGGAVTGRHSFQVEEFVPERIKATASPLAAEVSAGEQPSFWVQADYLFGAPARGERVEAKCIVEPAELKFDLFPGYTFSVWRDQPLKPLPLGSITDTLNDKGSASLSCPAVADVVNMKGPAEVKLLASVFEAGSGRTTVAHATVKVHPDLHYIGLKSSSDTASSGKKVDIKGVVVDWHGDLAGEATEVDIEVLELESEWTWEYDQESGTGHSNRYIREASLKKDKVKAKDGRFTYSFTPENYAEAYLVRATSGPKIQTDLYLRNGDYYWWEEEEYGYYGNSDRTPGPMAPEGLALHLPDSATAGESVPVSVDLPYPGRLLLTVETDRVIEAHWYDAAPGRFTSQFIVKDFTPNVYVSALLIKDPFFESKQAFIPGRAFGVSSLKIEPVKHALAVKITAPDEIEPNHDLPIRLDVSGTHGGRVYATVAAVDEGVLQLTDFTSPDPLGDMFQKRGLAVSTFETIGWTMLLPPSSNSNSTGGDMAEEAYDTGAAGRRVQPVKPVALWSGLLTVGADGKAAVTFKVPTYRGKLRIMAVAATADRMGSASAQTVVRDPLVLQPSFPRFVVAGDEIVTPVFITNMTGATQTVSVELKPGPGIALQEPAVKSLVLEAGRAGTVTYLASVNAAYGKAVFDVEASAGKFRSRDHAELPIFLNGGETHDLFLHKLDPGSNELIGDLDGWLPQAEQTIVTLTNHRYAKELGHLKYLIRYPYGCIEQTTSTTRPLLYIGNLVSTIDPEILSDGSIEDKFMFGVRRLFSMQTPDGGFSYWPGQTANTYWGTAYATHVMLEGLDAGYPIDRDRVNDALSFMEKILNYRPNFIDPKYGYSVAASEPYMQFVLARAGRGRAARIRKLIKDPDSSWGELKQENLYLLKAALYLMGDPSYEKDLKNPPVVAVNKRRNGWSFWSELRTQGMMLEVGEDVLKDTSSLEPLAQSIANSLKGDSYYYTTQELSWCVSALGKRASRGATSWSDPLLSADGNSVPPLASGKGDKSAGWRIIGASGLKSLNLAVDKIEGGDLYALVRVEGIKPNTPPEVGDHYLEVGRTYHNEKGEEVDLKNLRLGDLVYVALTLTNDTNQMIRNVAMVDRFGAGFEIENPRLGREHPVAWSDPNTQWDTDYQNIRDDRIELFGSLNPRATVTQIYVVRAVTGGVFTTPPVRAEAMYDPEKWSQHTGDTMKIKDPWGALTE